MRLRGLALALFALVMLASAAEARRVALVIGQSAYVGGHAATVGLAPLKNPRNDAVALAALLANAGFDVLSCDGSKPGCFDLDAKRLAAALDRLEARAEDADTALVFFAGHGMAGAEGNMVTPTDARFDCKTGSILGGIAVERLMAATAPARNKLVILDACRDNPVGAVCPGLKDKRLSFTRIEAGALDRLLVVTSTQFGQVALDNPAGDHSPFAAALLDAFAKHPAVYFEQVLNEVAAATFKAAAGIEPGFRQLPGKVVGGAAPSDCLAGTNCLGDPRMAAMAKDNEALAADASAVRAIIADEERRRGKPYDHQERAAAVERIGRSLTSLAGSAEPKVQEASRLFGVGKVTEGRAKLEEALDDDEKAAVEIERLAKERRKALARNARDAADLTVGSDLVKALNYYQRATRNDSGDSSTWNAYGRAAVAAGRLDVANAAFTQAVASALEASEVFLRYWATIGLGDLAAAQNSLSDARRLYETAMEIARSEAAARPDESDWQRDLAVAYGRIGNVQLARGEPSAALTSYRKSNEIHRRLATADTDNKDAQNDLSLSHKKIGEVFVALGDLSAALGASKVALAISERLATNDPGNALWQSSLAHSHSKIGDVLFDQGDLPAALGAYKTALAIRERLAFADPANADRQRAVVTTIWRLAQLGTRAERHTRWVDVIRRLEDMQRRGILAPVDKQYIEAAKAELKKL